MKRLKALLESLGYQNIFTYINSGNVILETTKNKKVLEKTIPETLKKEFGFEIPTLVKTEQEIQNIAKAIPKQWQNDLTYKTDVAYLFPEIDSVKTIAELPINKDFIDVRYVKGALFWNVERRNYNKSRINKLIGNKLYQLMTVRNVNTARYLAGE